MMEAPRLFNRYHVSLVLVAGPSASGKTEVVRRLVDDVGGSFCRPRSYTTRLQRPGEDDREYVFVDDSTFDELKVGNSFLNCDEVYGHRYGIERASVAQILQEGRFPVKEVHPENHAAIKAAGYPTTSVVLMPTDSAKWRSELAKRDPERLAADEGYYSRLSVNSFDIARFVFPHEDVHTVADDLRRSLMSHASFGHCFPSPAEVDVTNQAGYDLIADEFVEGKRVTTDNFHTLSLPFFESELSSLLPGSRCLELGPGRGWLRKSVRWPAVDYVSLELSNAMAGSAPEDRTAPGKTLGSARAMPWPSAHFDVVVSSLADPFMYPVALAEIRRVLKPHGQFVFSTPAREWSDALRADGHTQKTSFAVAGHGVEVYSFTFNAAELRVLLASAGFRPLRMTEVTGSDLVGGISPAIVQAAANKKIHVKDLTIVHVVVAEAIDD